MESFSCSGNQSFFFFLCLCVSSHLVIHTNNQENKKEVLNVCLSVILLSREDCPIRIKDSFLQTGYFANGSHLLFMFMFIHWKSLKTIGKIFSYSKGSSYYVCFLGKVPRELQVILDSFHCSKK